MRIAFASCMFNRVYDDQAVWDWIGQQAPDRLLLLGDSLYLDVAGAESHPQDMGDDRFARHLFELYLELMAQPQFNNLVSSMPPGSVNAIWDDHDFLWNDALGAETYPLHTEKVRLSTAFHEAFRTALGLGLAPGSFPPTHDDPRFWSAPRALSTPSLQLAADLWLHLSDGRTNRTRTFLLRESKRTLLGAAQRAQFGAVIQGAPAHSIHLWASGSTIAGYQPYARDLAWLESVASTRRTLVLSGDIHRNRVDLFDTSGGFALFEATSSGAAINDAVVIGDPLRNYGLVDIDAQSVTVQLFDHNVVQRTLTLDRPTWRPV